MDIKSSSAFGSLSTQLAQAVQGLKSGAAGGAASGAPTQRSDFVGSLDAALKAVSRTQLQATETQRQFQLENPAVSLEETMIAMNKASISFSAAVQMRNRLVQAYEQVMNMPV
jgi:flagellar hook-basal body complex protein FliE